MKIKRKNIKETINTAYKNIKPILKPQDGLKHTLLLDDILASTQVFDVIGNVEYTLYLDNIITNLQIDGYIIEDIKTSSSWSSAVGLFYQTLIIYK